MTKAPFAWQLDLWQHLEQWRAGQCPHALLFTGAKGLGGQELVESFAQALLCTQKQSPCQNCQDCHLSGIHQHPNLHHFGFDEDKSIISVDEIRQLAPVLSLKSESMRVIVIEASKLNVASSNALLKILEEPNEHICFLLRADKASLLAPTIVSRCVMLTMPVPSLAQGVEFLKGQGFSEDDAKFALRFCEGEPFRALHYLQTDNVEIRKQILTDCFDLIKGTVLPTDIADSWAKADLQEALYLCYSLMADLCMLSSNAQTSSLKNQDCLDKMTESAQGVVPAQLFELIETWKNVQKALKANTKAQYALYPLLIGLSHLKVKEKSHG